MKKLFSIALVLALAISMSGTVFAADTTVNQGSSNQTGKTSVTYEVSPTYTVTIPEKVTLGGDAVYVKAEGVKVAYGKQVVVKLTGINVTADNIDGDNAFTVKNSEGVSLAYTVKSGDTTINLDDAVLTVNPDSTTAAAVASGETALTFTLADNQTVQYAGIYSGTVTFTVSVDSVSDTTP